MSLSYPLTIPTATGFASIQWMPRTVVGMTQSTFTGQQQVFAHPGQWLECTVGLPPMNDANAGIWASFFMALNGCEGTFLLGDSVRKTARGTIAGTVTVNTGAVANSTVLPITGGTGAFAVGDWLQVSTGANARLHRVLQLNAGSVDVFPKLRTAYANGTAIDYTSPQGLFRLMAPVPWAYDERKIASGISFSALEVMP